MIDEEVEHLALELAGILHAHHREGKQVLVDARRRERIGGADLAPVFHHGLARLRAVDAVARNIVLRVGEQVIADPGERQVGDGFLVLVQPVEHIAVARRDDGVVVGEHHALRPSGRPRGVEDHGEVRALALRHRGVPARQPCGVGDLLAADLLYVVDPGQFRAVIVAQAARLVVDHVTQTGEAVGDRQHLVDLLLVLDHRHGDARVLQHIGHLVGNAVGVDRHRNGAERLAGAHRPVKPRAVAADDRELLAALEPELLETDRKGAHFFEHLPPGPRLPDAEVLVAHRNALAARLSRVLDQELRKCVRSAGAVIAHDAVPSCLAVRIRPRRLEIRTRCSPAPPLTGGPVGCGI
jgi:hypothetical protein